MPSWDDVEVGDKVTFETVGIITDNGLVMEAMNGKRFSLKSEGFRSWAILKSVEKPVRTFKPGDVVHWKNDKHEIYTLGDGRWFDHANRRWYSCDEFSDGSWDFTSADYVLVEG